MTIRRMSVETHAACLSTFEDGCHGGVIENAESFVFMYISRLSSSNSLDGYQPTSCSSAPLASSLAISDFSLELRCCKVFPTLVNDNSNLPVAQVDIVLFLLVFALRPRSHAISKVNLLSPSLCFRNLADSCQHRIF